MAGAGGVVWGDNADKVISKEADNEVVSQVAWEGLQAEPEIFPVNKKEHTVIPTAFRLGMPENAAESAHRVIPSMERDCRGEVTEMEKRLVVPPR